MEYVTGVSKKETVEISEILSGDFEGKQVKVNGAVHTIRDMGEVAFVILRKREGLLQCVFEEGKTKFDLKELKEASTIEVEGTVRAEHRAPNGFEVRLDTIRCRNRRNSFRLRFPSGNFQRRWRRIWITVRLRCATSESARSSASRRAWSEDSVIFCTAKGLRRFIHRRSERKAPKAARICSGWSIFTDRQCCSRARSFTSR